MKYIGAWMTCLNNLIAAIAVWAMTKHDEFISSDRRHIYLASASITTLILSFAQASYAESASGGLASLVDAGAQQADSVRKSIIKACTLGAVVFAIVGVYNLYRKSNDNHGEVKAKSILVPLIAGGALGAIALIVNIGGQTVGIPSSAQGQIPN